MIFYFFFFLISSIKILLVCEDFLSASNKRIISEWSWINCHSPQRRLPAMPDIQHLSFFPWKWMYVCIFSITFVLTVSKLAFGNVRKNSRISNFRKGILVLQLQYNYRFPALVGIDNRILFKFISNLGGSNLQWQSLWQIY